MSTRQGKTDSRTGIRFRVGPDAPPVRFNNGTRQVKSQTRAFGLFNCFRRTIKAVEDVRQIPRFNTRTLIAYTNHYLVCMYPTSDLDLTFWRVLECIGNKIVNHLLQTGFIRQYDREFIGEICDDSMFV